MGAARVLVVDDEPIVRDVLRRYLARDGFEVHQAGDGEEALASLQADPPDLVLLDLMLPRKDGIEVFARIREHSDTPVIMLTAKGQQADRIVGLEIGADDYVVKPFSPREVLARVRTVLRRAGVPAGSKNPIVQVGDLRIDPRAREVLRGEGRLMLTPKEFDLLHFLAANAGTAFTRTELLDELWDFAYDGDPSTVTVHIRRLRAKVEDEPSRPRHLVTVWGVGYRFDP
jgi:two-component system response regulator ResD